MSRKFVLLTLLKDDPEYTEEDLRFYVCRCGAPNCRGTIVKTRRKLTT